MKSYASAMMELPRPVVLGTSDADGEHLRPAPASAERLVESHQLARDRRHAGRERILQRKQRSLRIEDISEVAKSFGMMFFSLFHARLGIVFLAAVGANVTGAAS